MQNKLLQTLLLTAVLFAPEPSEAMYKHKPEQGDDMSAHEWVKKGKYALVGKVGSGLYVNKDLHTANTEFEINDVGGKLIREKAVFRLMLTGKASLLVAPTEVAGEPLILEYWLQTSPFLIDDYSVEAMTLDWTENLKQTLKQMVQNRYKSAANQLAPDLPVRLTLRSSQGESISIDTTWVVVR